MHGFGSFREAIAVADALPKAGHAILLGGDTIGLDLGRTLLDIGHRVTVAVEKHTFWPHESRRRRAPPVRRRRCPTWASKSSMRRRAGRSRRCAPASRARRRAAWSSTTAPRSTATSSCPSSASRPRSTSCSAPAWTSSAACWCSPTCAPPTRPSTPPATSARSGPIADQRYRFYYGWKNVRAMGELAARNITGADEPWVPTQDERLQMTADGQHPLAVLGVRMNRDRHPDRHLRLRRRRHHRRRRHPARTPWPASATASSPSTPIRPRSAASASASPGCASPPSRPIR